MDVERGTMGRLPYFATGSGQPLVVLGGLSPETGVESDSAVRMNGGFVKPFAARRRVHFFNRRPDLPRGMTMGEMAAEHAEALAEGFGGEPVDVMGISTGGSIAQQLAADHPAAVRRLVLASTGRRLGPEGRVLQRRVAARIRRGANRQAFAVMTAGLVPRGKVAAGALAWLWAPRLAHSQRDLDDMATTIEAEDDFDLAACGRPIAAPTLIFVGAKDVFYGRDVLEETARLVPDSRLELLEKRGHVTALMDKRFGRTVNEFLDADREAP